MLLVVIFGIISGTSSSLTSMLSGTGTIQQSGGSLSSVVVLPGTSSGSDTTPSGISKDIVSNVFKAIQITTQENLFLANLFTAASRISTLSFEATSVAINVRVLGAYIDLVTKSLELLEKHQKVGIGYGNLIQAVLEDTTRVMQGPLP